MPTFGQDTNIQYSNRALLEMLQSGDKLNNNKALEHLYKRVSPKVHNFITKNNGNAEDAQDIFQEGLFALFKSAQQRKLHAGIEVEPYSYTICKYLWWKKLGKQERFTSVKNDLKSQLEQGASLSFVVPSIESDEERARLELVMLRIGKDCHQILKLFYYKNLKMKEIAEVMQLSSEQVAKNKKSNCMKKLRSLVFQSPDHLSLR